MTDKTTKIVQNIFIAPEASVLEALGLMDKNDSKLLIVGSEDNYVSMLSIGDIQRHLLKTQDYTTNVKSIVRDNVIVVSRDLSRSEIATIMMSKRIEFMPIVDNSQVVDVVFWKDIIDHTQVSKPLPSEIPVVIMAGGFGTRLRPLTNVIPKPLVPIGDKPIMERIIDSFVNCGITQFYATVNYKAEFIKFYFDNIKDRGYDLGYYVEDKPLGTAGSLHLLKDKISTTFFVSNCDIQIDQEYADILEYHKSNQNDLTVVAAIKNYSIPYGTIDTAENGILKKLNEKPTLTFQVNTGVYVLEPHLLQEIPENKFFHITDLMEKITNRNGRVGVFPISEGSWKDIGVWDEYMKHQNG